MLLEKIKSPKDVKKIPIKKLPKLAIEMREALLNRVSKIGGHVGPNFGSVEATIALHYVFNCPTDKIIFDVSHQSYPHKLLTGRAYGFLNQNRFNEVSGYTNPHESKYDMFAIGHTSTSISLAIGVAKARDLKKQKYNVIAFIGDGSLSGGEALEGLNAISELKTKFIVVLNDNYMCMAEDHGGLYNSLKILRETNGKSSNNIFKSMGYNYIFVKDGNNINDLIKAFKTASKSSNPIIVHICTVKGKGLPYAEKDKEPWHYKMPFNPKTGELLQKPEENYSTIVRQYILEKAKKDKNFLAITSATPGSAGLDKKAREQLGKQFIDVGIAEQTAAAVAGGAASNGAKPLWTINSTFIQRAYDQISQDICLNNSPVAIACMFNGVYSLRDMTHLGFFDIPLLCNIPNLVYIAPTTKEEFLGALDYAVNQNQHPVIVRAPGGPIISSKKKCSKDFSRINKYEIISKGSKVAIIGAGSMYKLAQDTVDLYQKKFKDELTLINPYFLTGYDTSTLDSLKKNHKLIITIEDGVLDGGFGEKISRYFGNTNIKVLNYGLKKQFLDRFDLEEVLKNNHLKPELIVQDIRKHI